MTQEFIVVQLITYFLYIGDSFAAQGPALETADIESMKLSSMSPGVNKVSLNHTSYDSNRDDEQAACNRDDEQAACLNVHIRLNDSSCLSHNIDQHQFNEACDSLEEFACGSSEQLQLSTSVNQVANKCILNSGNNSANSKVTSL